jgi:hypothetical protein
MTSIGSPWKRESFVHELFVRERTLDFGGVKECDAAFDGRLKQ